MDIEKLPIDDLVKMRDQLLEVLAEKVQARQAELKAEADRLTAINGATSLKPKRPVKYRCGSVDWAGMGSMPKPFREYIDGGGKLEDLKV